jgi:hypothetical protein
MKQVAESIVKTTGGRLDLLVATHEHWDHLSGFVQAREEFKKLKQIDQVWLAWTEDPHDAEAARLRADRRQKLAALWMGLAHLGPRLGAAGAGMKALADQACEVLSFFGIDPRDPEPAGDFGAAAAGGGKTGEAMTWLQGKKPTYCRPGERRSLPGVDGVHVYVLGPPTDLAKLHATLPTRSGQETYGMTLRATSYDGAFFAALFPPAARDTRTAEQKEAYERSLPFGPAYRIPEEAARHDPSFQDYYGAPGNDPEGWRRIDADWLGGAAELALQLDSYTNNTSLALAIELPDGRVLLFPGDAQVGNWESWHDLTWKVDEKKVKAADLLNRTVLYKVGHHGSHNATLREKGLEMMISPGLVAMLPVDEKIAHDKKHWLRMPFQPLLERLGKKTEGRILRADQQPAARPKAAAAGGKAKADDPLTRAQFSPEKFTGSDRSLYVDYTLPL